MAEKAGVELDHLYEILTHATGDCVAVRTRLPAPGVVPDSPASNGWAPGFMTDLMAKDLDLAIDYASKAGTPLFTSGSRDRCSAPRVRRATAARTSRRSRRSSARSPASRSRRSARWPGSSPSTSGRARRRRRCGTTTSSSRSPVSPSSPRTPSRAAPSRIPATGGGRSSTPTARMRDTAPSAFASVSAIGFSAARETFALLDDRAPPARAPGCCGPTNEQPRRRVRARRARRVPGADRCGRQRRVARGEGALGRASPPGRARGGAAGSSHRVTWSWPG